MKKSYLKSAIATGIFASTIAIHGQASGAGSGAAVGGVTSGARGGGGTTARSGTVSARPASSGTVRGMRTQGAASITTPATTPPVGAASTIGNPQNTVGGAPSGNTFLSSPGTLAPTATLPGGGASANQVAIPLTSLPASVQTVLQGVTANGQVGSVTQIQGLNGPIYQAEISENGLPMQIQVSETGQILSRTPVSTSVGVGPVTAANATGTALGSTQAGLPVSSLPQAVQNSIQAQLGANGQVQTVSRDDLANDTIFRVTTTGQNGVPTEMRFAGNGTFIGSNPIGGGALTSAFVPTTAGILPGSSVVMGGLPTDVQSAIRSQIGNGRVTQMTQLPGTNGTMYAVSYEQNGRPMVMAIGADGRVISNNPIAVGGAANRATGTGAGTNSPAARTNNTGRTSLNINELPDPVQQTLKREAKYAEVRSITREQRVGGEVYTVALRGDETVGELTIGADGKVLSDNRRNFAEFSVPKVSVDDEQVSGIPFNTVPVAIQDAVKAYATASDIRSITFGSDKDGRAVYEIVYYHDGRRDRMIVLKNGTLRRIEQNVSPALELPNPNKQPVIAIGDLPQAVRDTIRRQTDGVSVKDITTKQIGSETVYQVHYQTNGAPVELLVGMDGGVVLPQGSLDREAAGAPRQAPLHPEELASAKVVNASPASTQSSGTAASSEQGTSKASTTAIAGSSELAPATKVNITDVPVAVQNSARKLAGDATIESITPKLSDTGVTYQVGFEQKGARRTIIVNKDGAVVKE